MKRILMSLTMLAAIMSLLVIQAVALTTAGTAKTAVAPGAASIPGDPFPWAPEAGPERAAAPTDPIRETPPELPDEDLYPPDLGEVD